MAPIDGLPAIVIVTNKFKKECKKSNFMQNVQMSQKVDIAFYNGHWGHNFRCNELVPVGNKREDYHLPPSLVCRSPSQLSWRAELKFVATAATSIRENCCQLCNFLWKQRIFFAYFASLHISHSKNLHFLFNFNQ